MVNSPRVKLLYDIYHMQIMEGDIIRTIHEHHTSFAHYHTAGNPGRHELDDLQELNYPPIIRAICETGYGLDRHAPVRPPEHDLARWLGSPADSGLLPKVSTVEIRSTNTTKMPKDRS